MSVHKIGMFIDQPVYLYAGTLGESVNTPDPLTVDHTCGVFFFDYEWKVPELRDLVASLIRQGCVSMTFHGCRCREAEDVADRRQRRYANDYLGRWGNYDERSP